MRAGLEREYSDTIPGTSFLPMHFRGLVLTHKFAAPGNEKKDRVRRRVAYTPIDADFLFIIAVGCDKNKRVKSIRSYPSGARPKDREKRGPKLVAFFGAEEPA